MGAHTSKSSAMGAGGNATVTERSNTLKVNGGTFVAAKAPALIKDSKGHTKYIEHDGYVMDVNGVPMHIYKNSYGNGYTMSAYGLFGRSYDTKKEMLESAASDAKRFAGQLNAQNISMMQAQLQAVKEAGSVSPQKLAAIRRKIQNESRKSK